MLAEVLCRIFFAEVGTGCRTCSLIPLWWGPVGDAALSKDKLLYEFLWACNDSKCVHGRMSATALSFWTSPAGNCRFYQVLLCEQANGPFKKVCNVHVCVCVYSHLPLGARSG